MKRIPCALAIAVIVGCYWTVACCWSGEALAKGEDDPIVVGELGAEVEQAVDGVEGFWGSVLVARGGEIVFAEGYGMADFDKTPCTPATLYELASVSKQVTAAAILHLAQRGKLSLDDTIDRFFEDVPKTKRGITVHMLLTHTSGLSGRGVAYDDASPRDRYVEQMMARDLEAPPGTTYAYNNVGYALLGCIVEIVGRTSFEMYCEKHLFKPAGMRDTGFIGDQDLKKSKRVSHRRDDGVTDRTAADWNWGWGYRGMGGVVTTVLDMHKWDRALRGDDILDEETLATYYEPHRDGYACGWYVLTTDRGTRRVSHTGSVRGYKTNLVRYLEDDAMFVVLTNDLGSMSKVTRALDALLFDPVRMEATVDAGGYELSDVGAAQLGEDANWRAAVRRDELVLSLHDGKNAVMEVRAPRDIAKKLLADLDQAIRTREADDDGAAAAMEAGLYLGRYPPGVTKHELRDDVSMRIRPEYRGVGADGHAVLDRRVLFTLVDGERGQWPVMVKMNVAAATAMRAAIAKAVE